MNVHAKVPADGGLAYAKGYGLMQNPHPPYSVAGERWIRDWKLEKDDQEDRQQDRRARA